MNNKKVEQQINEGLAKVCEMLAEYKKTTPKQKEKFLKYAQTFRKLGQIKNTELNKPIKEVVVMAKKLTNAEKEEKEVKRVLEKIKKLEKVHPQACVERACYRYKIANLEKRNAEKKIAQLQKELQIAQRKLR